MAVVTPFVPLVLNNKYRILNKIGEGKFGKVFKGRILRGRRFGEHVAIKYSLEEADQETGKLPYSNIAHESKIINYLNQKTQATQRRPPHIFPYGPQLFWYGVIRHETAETADEEDDEQDAQQEVRANFMVTTFYEISLTDFIKKSGHGPKWILGELMDQIMAALRHIHDLYVIHRDIKPQNFMVHHGQIKLIDFGMATFYIDGETHEHLALPPDYDPKKDTKKTEILGSPNYISPYVHQGWPNSRRDDYISAGYVILFYLISGGQGGSGKLPWEGLAVSSRLRNPANQERLRRKLALIDSSDPSHPKLPPKLREFLEKCYRLKYADDFPQEVEDEAEVDDEDEDDDAGF